MFGPSHERLILGLGPKIRGLGLVSVSRKFRKISVSASSQTNNQKSRSHLGLGLQCTRNFGRSWSRSRLGLITRSLSLVSVSDCNVSFMSLTTTTTDHQHDHQHHHLRCSCSSPCSLILFASCCAFLFSRQTLDANLFFSRGDSENSAAALGDAPIMAVSRWSSLPICSSRRGFASASDAA